MLTLDHRKRIRRKTFNVYLLGDIHCGRIGVTYSKLEEAIDMIAADKTSYAALMGDQVEAIVPSDKRFAPSEQDGLYKRTSEQCEMIAGHLQPIKKQIISILNGNHEEKVSAVLNCSDAITKELGITLKSGSRTNKVHLTDNIRLWLTHGSSGCNSMAGDPEQIERNEAISIKRKLRRLSADCIVMAMGHVHKLRICKPTTGLMIVDGQQVYPEMLSDPVTGAIGEDYRYYCSTGSFVKGYLDGVDTYVERAGYAPTELGMIRVVIQKDKVVDVEKIIL